jgi:hypothetical protein
LGRRTRDRERKGHVPLWRVYEIGFEKLSTADDSFGSLASAFALPPSISSAY